MKLEYTEGCVCDSLTIDDEETCDIEIEKLQEVICKLIKKESDLAVLQQCFIGLITSQGTFTDMGHCECCDDYIYNYKLEI